MLNYKERWPFFAVFVYPALLVLYFMLHENNDNYGLIPTGYTFQQAGIYLGISLIISLVAWYLFKNAGKAMLFTLVIICMLLFFGAFHDAINKWPVPHFFTRYTFILGFLLFLAIALIVFFKRTHRLFDHAGRYIRILVVILCIWETAKLGMNIIGARQDNNILYAPGDRGTTIFRQAGSTNPNIYFIVFDMYTSSKSLQHEFGYDNTALDSFLHQQGFYMVPNSKSNYLLTPYSIASTLNFSYLVPNLNKHGTAKDMLKGQVTIAHNRLIPFLKSKGYTIYNHSGFKLPTPHTQKAFFDNMEKGLLSQQTLWGRFNRDLAWNFKPSIPTEDLYIRPVVTDNLERLQRSIDDTIRSPKFIYLHFMLPHEPFHFNRDGSMVQPGTQRSIKQQYLEQLIYTNTVVRSVITTIMEKDTARKVVILEGDHGFRDVGTPDKMALFFENLHAIYFYDQHYTALYDSISPVNTFRVVLNQYFGQELPYLKDTSIFVHEIDFLNGKALDW